jgi:hypothetical protein
LKSIKLLLKNGQKQLQIGIVIIMIATLFMSSGCMMMGAHMVKNAIGMDVNRVREVNTG